LHVGGRGRFGVVGAGPPPTLPMPDKSSDFTYLPPQIVSDHCYGKMPPSSSTSSTKYHPIVAGGHHFTENYGQSRYGTGRGLARSSGTTVMYSVQQPHSNLIYHREVIDRNGHQVLLPVGGHLRLDDDHVYLEEATGSRLYDQLHDADVHALTQYVEEEEEDVPEDQAVVQYCVDEDGVVVDDDTVVDGRNSATVKVVNRRQGSERKEEEREDEDNNEATSSLMANSGTIRTTTLMTVGKMPANILADEVEDHDH